MDAGPIERVDVLVTPADWLAALIASEGLVTDPSSTTSWLMSWLRTVGPDACLLVGRRSDGEITLAAALERVGPRARSYLRTVGFRQGPSSGIRADAPLERLIDRRAASLIRGALRQAELPATGILLADLAGPIRTSPTGPLVLVQTKWTAQASVGGHEEPDWERLFFGRKQCQQFRRARRNIVTEVGALAVGASGDAARQAADLAALVELKRRASTGQKMHSQIFTPALDRWFPILTEEAAGRGDLDVLIVTIEVDGRTLARTFGVKAGSTVNGLIQVYESDFARYGPGRLALREFLALGRDRGGRLLDFGKVDGDELPLFATGRAIKHDVVLPLGAIDRLTAPLVPVGLQARRHLRERPPRPGRLPGRAGIESGNR